MANSPSADVGSAAAPAPIWKTFATPDALDRRLADDIANTLADAIATRGAASLAVSGGSTPAGLFACLAHADLDWSRVTITLADDRWVPDEHADSNAALLRRQLLTGRAAAAHFVPLVNAAATPEAGLPAANAALAAVPWPLDVAVLGMGNDAHTASLFPCAAETAPALDAKGIARLVAVHPRTAPHARISLTLSALASARALWLHIVGDGKREVLHNALTDPARPLPIAQVLGAGHGDVRVYWSPAHA